MNVLRQFTSVIDNAPQKVRIVLTGIISVFLVVMIELRPWSSSHPAKHELEFRSEQKERRILSSPEPLVESDLDRQLLAETADLVNDIDPQFEALMAEKEYGKISDELLNRAALAVEGNDKEVLANILALLGQVAIEQHSLDTAEVYLFESLDLLRNSDDKDARARVYMQLGRTHLKSREIARQAGYAYDALQIGRNQLAKGQVNAAEKNILGSISHSLSINRYNAAASGYASLAKLKHKIGDEFGAEEASLEAVRLFSSSGQIKAALAQLDRLRKTGIEDWRLTGIEQEIDNNMTAYTESIEQLGIARDYRRLYHYYLSENQLSQAWHFRLLANESLQKVSKRAMFHRQQGVIAILYNSNEDMTLAKSYFNDAAQTFAKLEKNDLSERIATMRNGIF